MIVAIGGAASDGGLTELRSNVDLGLFGKSFDEPCSNPKLS